MQQEEVILSCTAARSADKYIEHALTCYEGPWQQLTLPHLATAGVHSSLQLSCALTQPGAVPADAVSSLRAAVQAHLDQRDIARVEQVRAAAPEHTQRG